MNRCSWRLLGALVVLLSPGLATALDLQNGDLVVTTTAPATVVRVRDGVPTTIFAGPPLVEPSKVALEADGGLLVADCGAQALIRVDPALETATLLTQDGFICPSGVAVSDTGDIFLSDRGDVTATPNVPGRIVQIDPVSGDVTRTITDGTGPTEVPFAIALEGSATLIVANVANAQNLSSIVRVTIASRNEVEISNPFDTPLLVFPSDVAVATTGDIFVSVVGFALFGVAPQLFRFTPSIPSQRSTIHLDVAIRSPAGVAVDSSGQLLFLDDCTTETASGCVSGTIYRVDPATGTSTVLLDPIIEPKGILEVSGLGAVALCGDVSDDGVVDALDADGLRNALLGNPSAIANAAKCNVFGPTDPTLAENGLPTDCDLVDVAVLRRALAGLPPDVAQVCSAAGAQPSP